MSETALVQAILLALGARPDCRAWRNNTGRLANPRSGRWVAFGLPGSADILGILRGGTFLAVECKTRTGRTRDAQEAFGRMVASMGGVYVLARSVEDAVAAVDAFLGSQTDP